VKLPVGRKLCSPPLSLKANEGECSGATGASAPVAWIDNWLPFFFFFPSSFFLSLITRCGSCAEQGDAAYQGILRHSAPEVFRGRG